jgi:muramidase (phage lysozyme)
VKAVSQSVNDLGDYLTRQFYTFFGIKSPSTLMIKEVGIPIGQGIANGVGQGFAASFGMARDQIVQTLEGLLQDPKIQALLATIQTAEGGKLNVMAGGRTVLSGAAHPGEIVPSSQWFQGSKGPSSAAGLFQITRTNWRSIAPKLGLNNFSDPHQQQLAALYLMSQHTGGLEALTSGDPSRMMGLAAKDWSSTPGQHIGGGRAWSSDRWLGQFNKSLGGGGAMPVSVVQWGGQDIQGQGAAIFGAGAGAGGQQDISGAAKTVFGRSPGVLEATADIQTFTQTINDTIPVVVDAERAQEDLLQTDTKHDAMLARRSTLMLKATTPLAALTDAEQKHADGAIAITKAYQEAAKKQLIIGRDIVTELSGALGQVAGMAPTETVGKKRGLFSKILGIAAPFLSLLPGGGLISTIAGIASAGLGGNWSGAITGLAGGLAAGGALRPAPKDESSHLPGLISSSATPMATSIDLKPLIPRQSGGPVYRGHTYLVGERQPELLTPGFNGYVSPSAGAGGGDAGGIAAAAAELRAAVAHLNSMPAHHVVMSGARGLVRAMDHDAGLIRLVSQRQRLA